MSYHVPNDLLLMEDKVLDGKLFSALFYILQSCLMWRYVAWVHQRHCKYHYCLNFSLMNPFHWWILFTAKSAHITNDAFTRQLPSDGKDITQSFPGAETLDIITSVYTCTSGMLHHPGASLSECLIHPHVGDHTRWHAAFIQLDQLLWLHKDKFHIQPVSYVAYRGILAVYERSSW